MNSQASARSTPSPAELAQRKRRALLRRFWHSASLYWGKNGGKQAWLLTGGLFAIVLLNLASAYGMNVWNRAIFDALEKRNSSDVLSISLLYFPLLIASVCVAIAQVYVRMTTQRHWRSWLSNRLLDRWIRDGRYYQLNLISGDHQNPEYRIADDVRIATEVAGRFCHRSDRGGAVCAHVHHRALDHRRRTDNRHWHQQYHGSGFSGDRGRGLCVDRQRLDGVHRTPVRGRLRE